MSFQEMKRQAALQWQETQRSPRPRVLIGTATCGMASGAEEIMQTLEKDLAKHGIQADIVEVGCIGLCYAEPMIEVVKPGKPSVFYGNLTTELTSEIVRDWLAGDNPRPDLALGARGDRHVAGM